jgi:hypothetical protein
MVGGVKEVKSLPSHPECTKTAPTHHSRFPALFALKITENAAFYLKALNKIYSQDVF